MKKVEGAVEIAGEGYERVITIQQQELKCDRCTKELRQNDVVYWCKSRRLHCENDNCKYGNSFGPCKYQHLQVEHEHLRATLRLVS